MLCAYKVDIILIYVCVDKGVFGSTLLHSMKKILKHLSQLHSTPLKIGFTPPFLWSSSRGVPPNPGAGRVGKNYPPMPQIM